MKRTWKFILCISLLIPGTLTGQPATPFLRLESSMHNAAGRKLATDAAGKYVLTCSDDKTARLWEATSGKLLKIFRVPIGDTREGKLYACAISPDTKWIAVGGQTGFEWLNSFSVYILDTQTGEIIQRLDNLPAGINDLEISADGKYLAVALGKTAGTRIYETAKWNEFKKLEGYGGVVLNVAFTKKGQLITSCFDGKLRTYDSKFDSLLVYSQGLPGQRIISLAASPDGEFVAIGYHDSPVIEVRAVKDLSVVYLPSVKGAENEKGGLEFLSFSTDGKSLYGGGRWQNTDGKGYKWVVRTWNDGGRGSYTDLPLNRNTIADIKAIPNGSFVVLGSYPDLAMIDHGAIKWYHAAANIDFTIQDRSGFRVTNDGSGISFSPGIVYSFDIASRKLSGTTLPAEPPTDSSGISVVKDWQTLAPLINGIKVNFFSENERAYSTDINKDGKRIILGGFNLYLSNNRAEKIWKTTLPALALAVKISANEKTVVANLSDGTIRWYSMTDGKELLAFYLHNDAQRWVLFTPGGYYDAAPGAEDMLGWHLNNGPAKAASWFPVSRFREKFFRPDIIDAVFETYHEAQAISLANERKGIKEENNLADVFKKPPPTILITSPANGSLVSSNTITVSYSLNFPEGAPPKSFRVLVNGRPVSTARGAQTQSTGAKQVEVSIPAADCVVTLLSENDFGTSPEANLFLKWAPDNANDQASSKPRLYVLAIGISKYMKEQYRLNFAAKDAHDFSGAMARQKGKYYRDVVVRTVSDQEATKVNILDGLQWIQEKTGRNDMAMIFFAGHGVNDNNGLFYMLPVDADAERLRATCINFEEIKQTQSTIEGKVIVFIDACHSGNIMGGTGNYINGMINLLTSTVKGAGAITLTSSTGKEYSLEDAGWGNGAFTKALVEGLNGAAAIEGEKEITYTSLALYISRRVKKLSSDRQHPTLVPTPNTPDFTVAMHD